MSKFICDGCGRFCDSEEYGGEVKLTRMGDAYGGPTITLRYCKGCWEKREEGQKEE